MASAKGDAGQTALDCGPRSLSARPASDLERGRWARELQDETLQRLVAVRVQLGVALRGSGEALPAAVTDAIAALGGEVSRLRSLVGELRPLSLDSAGLAAALERLADRARERGALIVELDLSRWRAERPPVEMDAEREAILYRVAEEALTNAISHADATRVEIGLRRSIGAATLGVRDDGCGFDPGARSGGLGLALLEERVSQAGGTLRVRSASGAGTMISARIPLPRTPSRSMRAGRPAVPG